MPTYDYACPSCGEFDVIRRMDQRNEPVACPDCGATSERVIVSAAGLAYVDAVTRRSVETNERARNEPKSSKNHVSHRHPAGCGCCASSGKRSSTVTTANGNKIFPSKRPWMISH